MSKIPSINITLDFGGIMKKTAPPVAKKKKKKPEEEEKDTALLRELRAMRGDIKGLPHAEAHGGGR